MAVGLNNCTVIGRLVRDPELHTSQNGKPYTKFTLAVERAERPEEIDKFRAEAALERAREQLQQKQSIMEYHISSASMARAMARLRGVSKFDIH